MFTAPTLSVSAVFDATIHPGSVPYSDSAVRGGWIGCLRKRTQLHSTASAPWRLQFSCKAAAPWASACAHSTGRRHRSVTASGWPQPLRTAIRLILNTGHPMYVWWGPDLLCFYNDAYSQSIGPERHPGSLGQPGRQVWAEIWNIIGPQVDQVMTGGGPTWQGKRADPDHPQRAARRRLLDLQLRSHRR